MATKANVLVIAGASGYLGRLLFEYLSNLDLNVRVTTRAQPTGGHEMLLDLLSPDSISATFAAFPPDVVINTAAISQPGQCEVDEQKATETNAPRHLIAALEKKPGALLIQLSTDQVFDGSRSNSGEDAPTEPINAYGRSKLKAETMIRASVGLSYVILRSSIIVGPDTGVERPLFVQFIRNRLKDNIPTSYLCDEWRCPIFAGDICAITQWFILEHIKCKDSGTTFRAAFNMGGPDRLSRLDMAHSVAEAIGIEDPSALILPCNTADLSRPYQSPEDISMDSTAVFRLTGVHPTSFHDMIRMIDL